MRIRNVENYVKSRLNSSISITYNVFFFIKHTVDLKKKCFSEAGTNKISQKARRNKTTALLKFFPVNITKILAAI